MGLQETIEDLKNQITEVEKEEQAQEPAKEEEAPKQEQAKEEPEKQQEEEKKEEPAQEQKEEPKKEEVDNSGFARLRREAKAAQEKAEKEAARVAELQAKLQEKEAQPEAKEEVELPPALQEMLQEHMYSKAEREYLAFEEQAKRGNPDYESVATAYVIEKARQIKAMEPDLSVLELQDRVKADILRSASSLMQKGFENPALELYHRIKEAGYRMPEQPKEQKQEVQKEEKPKVPDMKKVAENRARSSGMAGASGMSEPQLTPQAAANMTAREWSKLSPDQKDSVMKQLRA